MQIVIIILGLILVVLMVKRFTTRCPHCGAVGKYKNLGRTFVGYDTSSSWRRVNRNRRQQRKVYNEKYECTECNKEFSKKTKVTSRTR